MPETIIILKRNRRRRALFLFFVSASTIVLWSIALLIVFSGYEIAFFGLISVVGLIALWEFYGMLDHKGLPNFKITAMICGAVMLVRQFLLLLAIRSGAFLRLRNGGAALFSAHRFHAANVREPAGRRAAADDGLHALRAALCALALQLHHEDRLRDAARAERGGDRAVLRFILHRDHEIQRHGRVSDRQFDRPSPVGAAHQPEENLGGIFRRARVFAARERRPFQADAGASCRC